MTDKSKSDPTKDPEFQKVVRRFLKTPPKPHKPKKGEQEQNHEENGGKAPS